MTDISARITAEVAERYRSVRAHQIAIARSTTRCITFTRPRTCPTTP